MAGYPGGAYPGNQGGYPGGGVAGQPSGGYPGASSNQGGYPGGAPGVRPSTAGYTGAPGSQGVGYPGASPYQRGPAPTAPQAGGYPGSVPPQGAYPTGPHTGQATGPGAYGQPRPQVDPNVQQWFSSVDTDRSGHINAEELRRALVNGNWSNFSEEACRIMIEMYDTDRTGTIDIHEFQQLFNCINQWRGVFQGYDTDRSGSIDQSELTKAFQQMGYNFSARFIQGLLAKYGFHTKKLTLDHFIVVCTHIKRLTEGFRSRDRSMQGQATMQYEDFVGLAMGVHQ